MAQRSLEQTLAIERASVSAARRPSSSSRWRSLRGPLVLVGADTFWLVLAALVPLTLGSVSAGLADSVGSAHSVRDYAVGSTAFVLLSLLFLSVARVYDHWSYRSPVKGWHRAMGSVSSASVFLGLLDVLTPSGGHNPAWWMLVGASAALLLVVGRGLMVPAFGFLRRWGIGSRRLLLVGSPRSASYALHKLRQKGSAYQIMGLINVRDERNGADRLDGLPLLGRLDSLSDVLKAQSPCEVLLAVPPRDYVRVWEVAAPQIPPGTTVRLALYPLLHGVAVEDTMVAEGFPTVRLRAGLASWQYETLKRLFDLAVGIAALVITAPLMLAIAVGIKLDSPGPVMFRQVRIGRRGQSFEMIKFRSMRQDAENLREQLVERNEASGLMFKIRDDPRVTRVGKIIRKFSLDELPQVFNVLEGAMSLVGPRPPLPEEVRDYKDWHLRRLEAVPGMTGHWQVNRGEEINFDEMVRLDIQYIENWSLLLDILIILKTFVSVLRARGAY